MVHRLPLLSYRQCSLLYNMATMATEHLISHAPAICSQDSKTYPFAVLSCADSQTPSLLSLSSAVFADRYDKRLELAPRDVVARAIQDQMLARGESHVLLDISQKVPLLPVPEPALQRLLRLFERVCHTAPHCISESPFNIPIAVGRHICL